jgi:hypothetical protein
MILDGAWCSLYCRHRIWALEMEVLREIPTKSGACFVLCAACFGSLMDLFQEKNLTTMDENCFSSELMTYLSAHREADQFALVGHSTGCQNAIHFLKVGQLCC